MKKLLFFALFFFLTNIQASILPPNCNAFQGEQFTDCQNILTDTSLSLEQKQDLYLNLINSQSELGSYDFSWNWNKNLSFNTPPAQAQSQGIIQNAWVKIVGFEKAFYDQDRNQWFLLPTGKVLFRANYSLQIPSGTAPRDCQTNYSNSVLEDTKRILLNGNQIGNQSETAYELPQQDGLSAEFTVELRVHTLLQIDHYQLQQHGYWFNGHWYYWTTCDYHHTENQENQITLQDVRKAKTITTKSLLSARFEQKNDYYSTRFELDSNQPINRLKIEIGNGSFEFSKTAFDLNAEPNGIISVIRKNKDTNSINRLSLEEFGQNTNRFVLGVAQIAPCTATITTDFEETVQDCGLTPLNPTFLDLALDKNSFDQNEQIHAAITLTNQNQEPLPQKTVFLKTIHGTLSLETNQNGKINATVPASQTNGSLTAEFAGEKEFGSSTQTKRFSLYSEENHQTGISVVLFFGAYYLFYLIAKTKIGAV